MARILFIWELGGGIGHITPYLGVAEALRRRGHKVAFILRELLRAPVLLQSRGFLAYQAPIRCYPVAGFPSALRSYSEILLAAGFADPTGLTGLVEGWRRLFELFQPDLAVFDHSPTALLASRAYPFAKLVAGNGFILPPDLQPMPLLRPWQKEDPWVAARLDGQLLDAINQELSRLGLPPIIRVGELLAGSGQLLTAFPELDPYQRWRQEPSLPLVTSRVGGERPVWPAGEGPRVFGYLRPSATLPPLLEALEARRLPTLLYGDGLPRALEERYASPTLRFVHRIQDLGVVGEEGDLMLLNGNLNSVSNLLLAGKPMLLLPLNLENLLTSIQVARMGAGRFVPSDAKGEKVGKGLGEVLKGLEGHRAAAAGFAQRHAGVRAAQQVERFRERVEALLPGGAPAPSAPG